MSLIGWVGGAVTMPDTGFWLPAEVGGGIVGFVFAGADGAVVMHSAVQHMITRIPMIIILFMDITSVIYGNERYMFRKAFILSYI